MAKFNTETSIKSSLSSRKMSNPTITYYHPYQTNTFKTFSLKRLSPTIHHNEQVLHLYFSSAVYSSPTKPDFWQIITCYNLAGDFV